MQTGPEGTVVIPQVTAGARGAGLADLVDLPDLPVKGRLERPRFP